MESEDFIALPNNGDSGFEDGELNNEKDSNDVETQPVSEDKEGKPNCENLGCESTAQCEESECIPEASLANELVDNDSDMEIEDINNLPALTSSGVKRPRTTFDEQQASVRVTYNFLTRLAGVTIVS